MKPGSSLRMKVTACILRQSLLLEPSRIMLRNAWWHKIFTVLLFSFASGFFIVPELSGQTVSDANQIQKSHSPKKATIYSAVLPGLGQAYNRKYWKIPIIYGGFGTIAYITRENTIEYRRFLEAYRYVSNKETYPIDNPYVDRYNEQQLLSGKNLYRRNVEIGYILGGALYILNIIDASVDAHLFYYDVSETLSLKIEPSLLNEPAANMSFAGISLTFRF